MSALGLVAIVLVCYASVLTVAALALAASRDHERRRSRLIEPDELGVRISRGVHR